jgi:hypothetical protein
VHLNLVTALADDHRRSCSCDGVTGQPLQLCRNCLARQNWRPHISRNFKSVRHGANWLARTWSWTPAAATSLLRIIAKVARS